MIFIGYDYLNDEIEWRKIYWTNGEVTKYSISNIGVVRNDKKDKIIKPTISKGYVRIGLTHNKETKTFWVHRLVALAFIDNPDNKPQVNHINGNKECNYVYNLEWVSCAENRTHAHKLKLIDNKHRKKYKKDVKKIHKVCKLLEQNELTYSDIAKAVGLTRTYVSRIHNKKVWEDISCMYDIDNYEVKKFIIKSGDSSNRTKYPDKDIHEVCKLIDTGLYELPQIALMSNIPYQTIRNVYYGTCRTDISSKYNFRKTKNPLYEKKRTIAKKVCELLNDGYNSREVSEKLGISRGFVRKILSGSTWNDISKDYNFSKIDNRLKNKSNNNP